MDGLTYHFHMNWSAILKMVDLQALMLFVGFAWNKNTWEHFVI